MNQIIKANEIVKVNNKDLEVKTLNGQRVITFRDIDRAHQRPEGTARRNFNTNQKYLVENEDYFILKPSNFRMCEFRISGISENELNNRGTFFFTETGYLMIVKSFTDPLAWEVQKQLVNSYFKLREITNDFNTNYPIDLQNLNQFIAELKNNLFTRADSIEEKLDSVIDNMTLSTRQQQKIAETVRNRVNELLGGAHTEEYKEYGRIYLINLWNGLKSKFVCGSSYKDLNPLYYDAAIEYIENWSYNDN